MVVSAAIHVAVLVVFCWPATPIFVRPLLLAHGEGGSSSSASVILYVPSDLMPPVPQSRSSLPVSARRPQKKVKAVKRLNDLERAETDDARIAGSRFGSSLEGLTEGDEIKPGFAITFTDPRVSRWELPSGVQGDVIVELTIDVEGNVIEEKLLQGMGHGIDERVIATLREWRFRPATRNGVAIPFKYDAHFHFPS
jgi:periplasmic protein TonB